MEGVIDREVSKATIKEAGETVEEDMISPTSRAEEGRTTTGKVGEDKVGTITRETTFMSINGTRITGEAKGIQVAIGRVKDSTTTGTTAVGEADTANKAGTSNKGRETTMGPITIKEGTKIGTTTGTVRTMASTTTSLPQPRIKKITHFNRTAQEEGNNNMITSVLPTSPTTNRTTTKETSSKEGSETKNKEVSGTSGRKEEETSDRGGRGEATLKAIGGMGRTRRGTTETDLSREEEEGTTRVEVGETTREGEDEKSSDQSR